ncbi:DNA gyrase subunit A, partial [Escherichia coli]|nr:DNA gyrase subunit A [Escherichia coli]
PGPDFPTGEIYNGRHGIEDAYLTGRDKENYRDRDDVEVDDKHGRQPNIVHETPCQVNKASLIEKIADRVKETRVEGVRALRDE